MIKSQKRGNLIIISGTTCAGKGTIVRRLLERNKNLFLSISYTSRPQRNSEVNGQDYYFVTQSEFEKKIEDGEFLEYAKVHYGCYYGTPKAEIEEKLNEGFDVILEIEVEGAKQIKELFPETILIFIMAPSMEIIKKRIKARNEENADQIIKRFKRAYQELNEINKYNYVVINDILEDAVRKVEAIILSEKCRVDRIEEIDMESEEEMIHEIMMEEN